ncbi:hypothetical protein A2303_01640 [Candidatus Falkowbacteria bacterium RIFOXYB2_FULL_47_14]|uniref:Glycerophosphoryl diester phosphodiesterase membrane domain-containing protein n=1 Tax=Candidatus Falkowbacteria bacterium RIFOXYA2_FULL_47_19 TaxID=1797994 RepID=A0A1F5SM77_9BACT|nr:MAG: hypothetical protein A2227_01715 [Candidatus Falkowbacteria bacterium RIFOXYA2_FULL_47_19]OGF43483.1 MAG: hypothetical protein A2303_01640 [Candidatus Falkowbacteria bacterium RIFOXYB2_FULL_47_14]
MSQSQTTASAEARAGGPINRKISPVAVLLKESWVLYKNNFWRFVGMLLVPLLGLLPLAIIFILNGVLTFLNNGNIVLLFLRYLLILLGAGSVVFLVVIAIISRAGLFVMVKNAGERPTVKGSFLEAKKISWKFFATSVITAVFVFLWTLLLVVPGIIAAINYGFALWFLVYEGVGGVSAIKRSRELVRGYWWAVAGRLLLLQALFFLLIVLPLTFTKNETFVVIWNFVSQIVSFAFMPFVLIYSHLIYQNLRKIKL